MSKIESMHQRLSNIRVCIARVCAEPSINGIDALIDRREAVSIQDALNCASLFIGNFGILMSQRNGCSEVSKSDMACTE